MTVTTPALTTITGHVHGRPQVRARPHGPAGHSVPVLCLDLLPDGAASGHLVHVQQPFAESCWRQCEAAARRIRAGQHVTVQAPVEALRLTITDAAHIRSGNTDTNDHHHPQDHD